MKVIANRISLSPTRALTLTAQALAVAVALAAAAKVRLWLPGSPVPVTLQTLVVLAAPALMGLAAGAGGVAIYIAAATCGLPVIAGPSVFGPTGGYLLGFLAASALVAAHRRSGPLRLLLAMAAASALVYLSGAAWLWAWSGKSAGWVLAAGVLPFLPGDVAKLLAAWVLVAGHQGLTRRLQR